MIKSVITLCGDPGGAEALAPVLASLSVDAGIQLENFAYNEGVGVLTRHGIAHRAAGTVAEVIRSLTGTGAAMLLTATSCNDKNWERTAIAEARRRGIPSIAVLDFWSNYAARFACGRGSPPIFPDLIVAMDERARLEMAAAGIPAEIIVVAGQPAFDDLAAERAGFTAGHRSQLREEQGVPSTAMVALFASQPMQAATGEGPGFDELEVLAATVHAFESAIQSNGVRPWLVVRPHPRENCRKFADIRSDLVPVVVSSAGTGRQAAMAADLVVGMNSALLAEACFLGCAVISLQPGLRGPDPLPTNAAGQSRAVYRKEDIPAVLLPYLLREDVRRAAQRTAGASVPAGGAAARIAALIRDRLFHPAFEPSSHP
ncbi:MAG TPA: hypothetical protein VHC86_06615 [Opitutaceae bacterium]|nr:hypothetical protein [Opitutaceae bacterium]